MSRLPFEQMIASLRPCVASSPKSGTTNGVLSVVPFVAFSWSTGGTRLDAVGPAAWLACIAVVVFGAVGNVAFNRGIARVPAARAGQLGNLTPVVGTLT